MTRLTALWMLVWFFAACGAGTDGTGSELDPADVSSTEDAGVTEAAGPIEPASGPMSGYFPIVVDVVALGLDAADVTEVRVADILAYHPAATDDGALEVWVQGAPKDGSAEVVLTTADGAVVLDDGEFSYDPPADPRFARIVAIGASLTQGVQRGVPTFEGALMSPASQLARQLGGFMPLPLLHPGLFPQIGPDHVGEPPACKVPDVAAFVADQAIAILPKLTDPETDEVSIWLSRVDPDAPHGNIAVGNSNLGDVLHGADDNLPATFIGHMVYDPYNYVLDPLPMTQVELLESLEPTLILSFDLYGNDIIGPLVVGDDIDLDLVTPIDELVADIALIVERLAGTGAEVFLANLPRPTMLPVTASKLAAAPPELRADVQAKVAFVEEVAVTANEALEAAAEGYANVHVVDVFTIAEGLAADGLDVGGEHLSTAKFGGLVGLDGVHFSDTAYAMIANEFLLAIEAELGVAGPPIDLEVVHATDVDTPAALQASGLETGACEGAAW